MGDRISIRFVNGTERSVVLFSHWDGESLKTFAEDYVSKLKTKVSESDFSPLDRLEPNTVMLDFLLNLFKKENLSEVRSNYYLGKDESDGDNSDNGHFDIDLR